MNLRFILERIREAPIMNTNRVLTQIYRSLFQGRGNLQKNNQNTSFAFENRSIVRLIPKYAEKLLDFFLKRVILAYVL